MKTISNLKAIALVFALALSGSASTLSNTPDNASGLGAQVYAIPGTVWQVGFDDEWDDADANFTDVITTLTFGPNDIATLDYVSANTANLDLTRVAIAGAVSTWIFEGQSEYFLIPENSQVVAVQLLDATAPYGQYSSGPADLNPDGYVHTEATQLDPTSPTPEPAGWMLMLFGMALCAGGVKRYRGAA